MLFLGLLRQLANSLVGIVPADRDRSTGKAIDFEAAVKFSPSGIVITDNTLPDCPIIFVNQAFIQITGYSAEESVGRNCRFLQGAETSNEAIAALNDAFAKGVPVCVELLNYKKGGETFWNELRISPQFDGDGKLVRFVGIQSDVTERRKINDEKAEMQSRLASIVENMPGYIFQRTLKLDGSFGITYFSPSFASLLGIPSGDEISGADLWKFIHPDDRAVMRESIAQSAIALTPLSLEFRLRTKTGAVRWIRNRSSPTRQASGDVVWHGVGLDFTAEKAAEDRLSYLAHHDPLTGLANRDLFSAALLKTVNATLGGQEQLALFIIDLDAFEEINDAIGFSSADTLLRAVAQRIVDFAKIHHAMAARIGGDEFALFYTLPATESAIQDAAADLSRIFPALHKIAAGSFLVEASVGAAAYPFVSATNMESSAAALPELMKRASLALQEAKRIGRGLHRVYAAEKDDRHKNKILLRHSLRKAIDENQFVLHYQPLVDLHVGTIVGAEALIRWNHPELGIQRPDEFIPFAESSGLIIPLGGWVLKAAMQQVKAWRRSGLKVPKIAINVSGVQLLDPGFLRLVEDALEQTGTKANQFELELTEGSMIEASPTTLKVLRELKALGFTLAVDDFGAGHASFSYLRDFPVDKLKIDQSFVRQMVVDSSDASIIRAIIALGKSMNLEVVAEGIETVAQRNFLRDEGCRVGQGYLFSLPLTAEDLGYVVDRNVKLPRLTSPESPVRALTPAVIGMPEPHYDWRASTRRKGL